MSEFLANPSVEVIELLRDTVEKMVELFGISRAEAIARINAQWDGQEFLESSDIILHEDEYYWALFVYYDGAVPDWRPDADRSGWTPRAAPERGTDYWTVRE